MRSERRNAVNPTLRRFTTIFWMRRERRGNRAPRHGYEMTDPPKPVSHPWRRYLRFSVRGLIVVVLVIGIWLGWIVRRARIQREAVAAIKNAGGFVAYEWEWANGTLIPGAKPWAPRWLVDLIGVDYLGRVTDVQLLEFWRTTDRA